MNGRKANIWRSASVLINAVKMGFVCVICIGDFWLKCSAPLLLFETCVPINENERDNKDLITAYKSFTKSVIT